MPTNGRVQWCENGGRPLACDDQRSWVRWRSKTGGRRGEEGWRRGGLLTRTMCEIGAHPSAVESHKSSLGSSTSLRSMLSGTESRTTTGGSTLDGALMTSSSVWAAAEAWVVPRAPSRAVTLAAAAALELASRPALWVAWAALTSDMARAETRSTVIRGRGYATGWLVEGASWPTAGARVFCRAYGLGCGRERGRQAEVEGGQAANGYN